MACSERSDLHRFRQFDLPQRMAAGAKYKQHPLADRVEWLRNYIINGGGARANDEISGLQ